MPVPLSAAVWVPTLSTTVSVPDRDPEAVGRNTTDTVQPTPEASVAPHVFAEIAKSPVTTGVCSVTATPPLFETVMFCTALVAPTSVLGNVTAIGFNTTGAAAVAVPASDTVACPPLTFPYTDSTPDLEPVAAGKKLTRTAQLAPAAIDEPTHVSLSVKSPLATTLETSSAAVPLFVTVTVCAALSVPTCCAPNVSVVGVSDIAGIAGPVAVSSGISQMPRPYVPIRSSPVLPSPVAMPALACNATAGAFGSPVPYAVQQFADEQPVTFCVT
jgi:hypothetical protein